MQNLNLFNNMKSFFEKAPAKINLSLKILNKRQDGYHNLESYVVFANLHDVVSIKILNTKNNKIKFNIIGPFSKALKNEKYQNLCYKSALYFCNKYNIKSDMVIQLNKNLPISSGIGGGSADAAATIRLLCKIYNINLYKMLKNSSYDISKKLGTDIPACIHSKSLKITKIGENITNLPYFIKKLIKNYKWIVLITPNKNVSTKKVFKMYQKKKNIITNYNNNNLYKNVFTNNLKIFAENIEFEIITAQKLLSKQKNIIYYNMSGSGPTCYGVFKNKSSAKNAMLNLKSFKPKWWINYSKIIN